jgi:hypothetical protein
MTNKLQFVKNEYYYDLKSTLKRELTKPNDSIKDMNKFFQKFLLLNNKFQNSVFIEQLGSRNQTKYVFE